MRLCLIGNPNLAHIRRWVQDFANLGWEVHLIGEHQLRVAAPKNCIFYDLPKFFNARKLRYLAWGIAVRGLVKRIRPQLVHSLGVASAGWLGVLTNFRPFLVSALGSDLMLLDRRSAAHRTLSRIVLSKADYVLCVSTPLFQKAGEFGVTLDRRQIVYLGVNTDIFNSNQDRKNLRQVLGLPQSPLALNLRAIHDVYRPLDLAQAIPAVLNRVQEANFAVFTYNSDPVLLAEFRRKIEVAGAGNSVFYIPPLIDDRVIASYFQAADVAISIPTSDGMPASVLEAMACGCSLVASDLPNLKEWVRDEQEGLIVPVGNVPKLEDALVRLLTDAPLRMRIQANAIQVIQRQGSRQQTLKLVQQIYEKFIS